MPHFVLQFDLISGPVVTTYVGVTSARHAALTKAGQPIPTPVVARMLVDTGASCTCVDPTIIAQLGISPSGSMPIQTPSTAGAPVNVNQYDVAFFLPGATSADVKFIDAMPIVESHLKSQGIDGLLGRDVLASCLMNYDGKSGLITIAF